MISGIGPDGEEFDEISLRSELLRLREGVEMEIPNDATGGMETWVVEIHLLGWLADLLVAHGLGPWPESFQERHACRDCWWHSGCWCAYLPKGSMEARAKRPHANEAETDKVGDGALACSPHSDAPSSKRKGHDASSIASNSSATIAPPASHDSSSRGSTHPNEPALPSHEHLISSSDIAELQTTISAPSDPRQEVRVQRCVCC